MQRCRVIAVLALASLVNIYPTLLSLGGDILFHRSMIHCFATQFWQGDLYPRWCMESNNRLGAPLFMFYFPLPYFIAALIWPITWLGANSDHVYVLGCFLATLLTGLTCYLWLKDVVASRYAVLASIVFLFVPYRMELIAFRNAYSELWGIAFMPLVLMYTRRLALSPPGGQGVIKVGLSFALLLLAHVPVAAMTALASGLYMLMMAQGNWQKIWRYAEAMLLGGVMAAFYLLPALYYKQFINTYQPFVPWPDTFFDMFGMVRNDKWRLAGFTTVNILITGIMIVWWLVEARKLAMPLRREMGAWGSILAMALFLLFPVSKPLYDAAPFLHQVILPWRALSLFAPCVAFMLAVWLQWLMPPGRLKFWKTDFACALMLLVMFDMLIIGVYTGDFKGAVNQDIAAHYIHFPDQYQTRWTPKDRYTESYLADLSRPVQSVTIVAGRGDANVIHWGWDAIRLDSDARTDATLHLSHIYFPIWQTTDERHKTLHFYPDPASGEMLLDVPEGKHTITLRRDIIGSMPVLLRLACLGSEATLVIALFMVSPLRRRSHG